MRDETMGVAVSWCGSWGNASRAGAHLPARAALLRGTSALALALCAAAPALAQEKQPMQLPPVSVEDTAQQPYKPETAASPKYTAPLLNTPQTITVIPEQVIKDQNLLTLRDILSTVPGITFGAGEGGGGYGDSITLRGFTASTDVTIDGLRDSAQYTRSDPFNTEQVEVVNGANSVYGGAGSIGGSINLVSKMAKEGDFTNLSAGIGTDNYYRATVDANHMITETIGLRLNAMGHMNDVPGRDVEDYKRWGLSPSVAFGLTTPTRVTLSYLYQKDNNIPQYGVGYFRNAFNNGPLADADPSDYFGYRNMDTQNVELNQGTVKIEHAFNEKFSVRNLTRWQRTTQFSIVNPPQGTYCTSAGINPATGAPCAAPNTYVPSGPRGTLRDTDNKALINQTDLIVQFNTGRISHNAVAGLVVSNETFHLDNGNTQRTATGGTPTYPAMTISNPNTIYTGPVNFIQAAAQDGEVDNQAFYLFDTARIIEQIEFNFGLRYERNRGTHTTATYTATGAFSAQGPIFRNSDNLFSYRAGLVYKPVEEASLYVAYGSQKLPSKGSVNGACTAANCNVRPESGESYEIGAKWNLLENRLSTTAAIFRNKRSNYRVTSNDPTLPADQLDGSARVDGIALGVSGQITPEWLVFTNYTYLKSKVLQGVSNFCLANPTAAGCFAATTPLAGNPLNQVPDHAASLWTTYQLPRNFQVGYGFTYQGEMFLNNGAPPLFKAPSYWVHKAMLGYRINARAGVQMNVNNLFDNAYYTRIRNNGWATVGDARSFTFTLNYNF
ncbi:MAG: TonB-dependent siderophore receptor [Rhodospirillaceae bacterium]|nr:TonB-dependent siderophore receptor [Rhodospirillaceae bacterium]